MRVRLGGPLPLLYKWLPYKNVKFRTWVQLRIVVSGRYTHAQSLNHIDRLIANSIVKGTFDSPRFIGPDDLESVRTDPRTKHETPYHKGESYTKGSPLLT